MAIKTGSGGLMPVIVPTRYVSYATAPGEGTAFRRYSMSAAADLVADMGFDGLDVSMEDVEGYDDAFESVCWALANRAAARGLSLPLCHLPFYMPDPDNGPAMTRFVRTQTRGLRAAARMGIPLAVIHPVVRHAARCTYDAWFRENIAMLAPLCGQAAADGITLCIEIMTGIPYPGHPGEAVYGSRASDIRQLANKLDCGICWDTGHAHLSGLVQSDALRTCGKRLMAVHLHDNDGIHDLHRIPGDGTVDWDDTARGLRLAGFTGAGAQPLPGHPAQALDLELKTSDLPADRDVRSAHAARALAAAARIAQKL